MDQTGIGVRTRCGVITAIAVAMCGVASAGFVTGGASIGGGNVQVSGTGSDFESYDSGNSQCDVAGGGSGCFEVTAATGSFSTSSNPQLSSIHDLLSPLAGSGALLLSTQTTGFLSFDGGAVVMDLLDIMPGAAPDCALAPSLTALGAYCTIYLHTPFGYLPTPYALMNEGGNTVGVSTVMEFNAYTNGTTADGFTPYVGIFGTTVTGYNIQTIANQIETPGGFVSSSWQAQFAPESPEPATVLLGLGGVVLISISRLKAGRA